VKIVSVINQKGGVAKTTTCANLGACLAARGLSTFLIDLDPQANLTLGLGARRQAGKFGLHDVLLRRESAGLVDVSVPIGDIPLQLAPGNIEMAHTEAILTPVIGSAYRMREALEVLAENAPVDWVLIDCPPSLGRLTEMAVVASTHLLIPTEPKYYSFAGMDTLNKMIVGLTKDLRFDVELLGVLITMFERRTKLHKTIAAEIRERFGEKVFETVIHKNIRLSESELEGRPVIHFDSHSSGARDYDALADEVLSRAGG
jgi:chromosome partitioning protein